MSGRALSVLVDAECGAPALVECLASVAFADERIVSVGNPDGEEARLARALGARIAIAGDDPAPAGDWLLILDADMQVPPQLADEIRAAVDASAASVHVIGVRNLVGGRWIRHGWTAAMAPATQPCLRRREGPQGPAAQLRIPVDRHVGRNVSELLRRLDRETTRRADAMARQGAAGTLAGARRACCAGFIASYVGRGGFREGRMGLVLAICAALAPVLCQTKATLEHRA